MGGNAVLHRYCYHEKESIHLKAFLHRFLWISLLLLWLLASALGALAWSATAQRGWILPLLLCIGCGVIVIGFIMRLFAHQLQQRFILPLENLAVATRQTARQSKPGTENSLQHNKQESYPELEELATEIDALVRYSNTIPEDMQRLQQVRSQFLGNVSHELRTPIFAIQGYLETLLDGALDDTKVRRAFVEKAYNNTKRLGTLLNDLMDISRIESGEMRMSFRYFNVMDVIRDILQQLEMYARQHDVRLSTEEQEEVMVFGDKERIAQVLANLISNAIKYNKPGGSVHIGVQQQPDEVQIAVSDTGMGIAPEHHSRVFERFYRVDTNRSRTAGGTGLGLAIVKHILEAHNTTITLQSEEGKGTTISFALKK